MSILEKLDYAGVAEFTLPFAPGDKSKVRICEQCDYCFYVDLNKTEMAQLIAELQAIHEEMV